MAERQSYPRLFSPAKIGQVTLNNRVVMAPMVTLLGSDTGAVTQRMLDYYAERARGDVGLIIVEATYIHPSGKAFPCQLGIDREGTLPGHFELVETIHRYGARAAIQVHHAGAHIAPMYCEATPVAPSPVSPPGSDTVPQELTVAEIEELADAFARSAERAKRAGYDAVELHGAHGFLIHHFLSPASNRRTDRYGGNLENRLRFPLLVVSRVREAVGSRYPLLVRMSAEGGYGLEEATEIARAFEQAGIDCIDVSIGGTAPTTLVLPHTSPMAIPEGYLVPHAATIKRALSIPTIAVGEIRHPLFAEQVLARGEADLIALARQFLADPEWPYKADEGLDEEIRLCISCDYCRLALRHNRPIRCLVNPAVGRERELAQPKPAEPSKRAIVVGGGPAGAEAARIAALRGHNVTLYEREREMGGQLWLAAAPPHKGKIHWFREHLEKAVRKAGVKILTSQAFDPSMLDRPGADVLILATGARPIRLDAPGADGGNVVYADDLLSGKTQTAGERVAVLGGRQVGC